MKRITARQLSLVALIWPVYGFAQALPKTDFAADVAPVSQALTSTMTDAKKQLETRHSQEAESAKNQALKRQLRESFDIEITKFRQAVANVHAADITDKKISYPATSFNADTGEYSVTGIVDGRIDEKTEVAYHRGLLWYDTYEKSWTQVHRTIIRKGNLATGNLVDSVSEASQPQHESKPKPLDNP